MRNKIRRRWPNREGLNSPLALFDPLVSGKSLAADKFALSKPATYALPFKTNLPLTDRTAFSPRHLVAQDAPKLYRKHN